MADKDSSMPKTLRDAKEKETLARKAVEADQVARGKDAIDLVGDLTKSERAPPRFVVLFPPRRDGLAHLPLLSR